MPRLRTIPMVDEGIKRMIHDIDSLKTEVLTLHERYDDLILKGEDFGDIPERVFEILLRINDMTDNIEEHAKSFKGPEHKELMKYVNETRDFLDEHVIDVDEDARKTKEKINKCRVCGRTYEGNSLFCSRKCESMYYDLNDEDS